MKNFLQNILREGKERKKIKVFQSLEDKINFIISKIEKQHKLYTESMEEEDTLKNKIENVQKENPEIIINDTNIERKVIQKRLKFLKWFAVFIESLLSYNAVNLFLKETIGISLASGSDETSGIVTMAKSLVVAIPVAFLFLQGALHFKYNDESHYSNEKGMRVYWYKVSWILTILVIPFLNLYIVLMHPGHETNIVWIFFSLITLLINIKLVNYSSQYNHLVKTERMEKEIKPINDAIEKEQTKQRTIKKNVQGVYDGLTRPATEFRRAYESFGEIKPTLTLSPIYRIFLNTYQYYMQVLPPGEIVITNPPAEFSNYFSFLDKTISPKENVNKSLEQSNESNDDFNDNQNADNLFSNSSEYSEDEIFI